MKLWRYHPATWLAGLTSGLCTATDTLAHTTPPEWYAFASVPARWGWFLVAIADFAWPGVLAGLIIALVIIAAHNGLMRFIGWRAGQHAEP